MQAISVIIVTWNGAELLDACLAGLERQTLIPSEIIVVDNASSDETPQVIQRHDVSVVRMETNVGFAAGANAGVLAASSPWVALLNNDAVPADDWVATLAAAIEDAAPDVGYFAGTLLLAGRTEIDSAGDAIDRAFTALPRRHGEPVERLADVEGRFVSACGGASAYRASMWHQLGGLAAPFFAYLEDADLSLRARQTGWRGEWLSDARVEHVHSATSGRLPGFKTYQNVRNSWFLFVRCVPRQLLWKALPLHLLSHAVWLGSACRSGEGRLVLRAWRDAFAAFPRLRRERRGIQAACTLAPRELWRELEPAREMRRFRRT